MTQVIFLAVGLRSMPLPQVCTAHNTLCNILQQPGKAWAAL